MNSSEEIIYKLSLLKEEAIKDITFLIEKNCNGYINLIENDIFISIDEDVCFLSINSYGKYIRDDSNHKEYDLNVLSIDEIINILVALERALSFINKK